MPKWLYKVIERKDPRTPSGQGNYYAVKLNLSKVTNKELAEYIATRAGQSQGTVLGLLEDMFQEMLRFLYDGYSVQFGDIGTLRCSFSGLGSENKDDWNTDLLSRVKVLFTPSAELKADIRPGSPYITLERVNFKTQNEEEDENENEGI